MSALLWQLNGLGNGVDHEGELIRSSRSGHEDVAPMPYHQGARHEDVAPMPYHRGARPKECQLREFSGIRHILEAWS